jgi:hypothetical protein
MIAACAALALTAAAATAQTIPPDRTTYVTFSAPISLPGMTLPAGTYTFKLLDSNTDRHIVQVFNREGTKLFTTLLAVPATRMEPTGDPVITFKETPSDRPPAVHYWYYAGDLAGNELVYPKNQAQMIANASGEAVMGVDSNGSSIDDWKRGSVSSVKPDNTAQPSSTASTTADNGSPKPTPPPATTTSDQSATSTTTAPSSDQRPTRTMDQSAPTTTTAPQTPAPTTAAPAPETSANTAVGTSGRTEALPKTASELPLVGLIGLFALAGAFALRAARTA